MSDYAVIIPAFNEATQLPATLASLRKAMEDAPGQGEVIVVDNGSTDETAAIARQASAWTGVSHSNEASNQARTAG